MEETPKIPLFKKIDQAVFERIDKFKQTPNYAPIQDFYNGLEEEQQKVFKGAVILALFLLPMLGLAIMSRQNSKLRSDLELRTSIIKKANEIIGQNRGIREVSPMILAGGPIDSASMMTTRLSNILSGVGVDLSKIQVGQFTSDMISSGVMKAEADLNFNNFSTDELMNMFTAMIQREKFRIQSVDIKKNMDSGLLQGQFHAIHYSVVSANQEE